MALFIVAVVGILAAYCHRKRMRRAAGETENAFPPGVNPGQKPGDDSSGCSPATTYASVQFPLSGKTSDKPRNNSQPETVYAEVNKGPGNKPEANELTA